MGLFDGRQERVWARFERRGGPTRLDRLTISQPIVVGVGMALVVGIMYLLVGSVIFDTPIDGAAAVESLLYGVIFTAVYVALQRQALRAAVERWDARHSGRRG